MKRYSFFLICIGYIVTNTYAYEPHEVTPDFYHWCQEVRDIPAQPYDAIINLGDNCQIAYQMRLHGIRSYSLPFDWIRTPFEGLKKILEEHFEHFLDPEYLILVQDEKEKHILNVYYGTQFLHDFKLTEDFMHEYNSIKTTYMRRINRFLQLLKNSRHTLFIRKKITKKQAVELRDLLHILCPDNDFLLLAVGSSNDMKTDWQIEHVKNMYLRPPLEASWKGDPEAWREIFLALGLHLSPAEEGPLFKEE